MESGREEGKNPSSTSWGENLRQTVFVEMLAKEAEHLLYYRKGWRGTRHENSHVLATALCGCVDLTGLFPVES